MNDQFQYKYICTECDIFSFPDVMMPSYARSKWFSIFFVSYLCTVLYVLMNLVSIRKSALVILNSMNSNSFQFYIQV